MLPAQSEMQEEKVPQFASPLHALYSVAHVPLSAVTSQLEHVVAVLWHTPLEQVPPSQELPQAPQSVLEIDRFWQPSVGHIVSPLGHVVALVHAPSTHESPLGHTRPQSPQFVSDDSRFTQLPLQSVSGLVQLVEPPRHTPASQ